MVGHRALVAIETTNGQYELYYSHDGAHEWRLATAIDAGTLRDQTLRHDRDTLRGVESIDSAPITTGVSFERIVERHVDFQQYGVLYRVPATGPVEPFLVCWFGLPGHDTAGPRDGALVAVDPSRPLADGEFLRGWFAGVSGLALVLVDEGTLVPERVSPILESHLRSWASDRECHVAPRSFE